MYVRDPGFFFGTLRVYVRQKLLKTGNKINEKQYKLGKYREIKKIYATHEETGFPQLFNLYAAGFPMLVIKYKYKIVKYKIKTTVGLWLMS